MVLVLRRRAMAAIKKLAQIGNVIIEDDVEIGSNTTVDRATMGSTIIRKGVKLDNLIQVAHNVEIGANTVVAAQSGHIGQYQNWRTGNYWAARLVSWPY
jgi:UDP-3-O-[3-hydroxymyristoyl] glucosamine N-acyltransferase